MFVKHWCPRRQQSQNMAKISKSYILTPPHPQGHGMPMKCEQPLDKLTVHVWLLYDHPNLTYCAFCKRDRITDRQTDRQTDYPNTRCPRWTFQTPVTMSYRWVIRSGNLGEYRGHILQYRGLWHQSLSYRLIIPYRGIKAVFPKKKKQKKTWSKDSGQWNVCRTTENLPKLACQTTSLNSFFFRKIV